LGHVAKEVPPPKGSPSWLDSHAQSHLLTHNPPHTHTPNRRTTSTRTRVRGKSNEAMEAAANETLSFRYMNEAQLRQWVEDNPERVNDRDMHQDTALFVAVCISLPLVVWLLDEKSADVNGTVASGITPLHAAVSPDIITALLDRGADPTLQHISIGSVPLLMQSYFGIVNNMAPLLQDPRVRANVNSQAHSGLTALHCACLSNSHETSVTSIILLLLQAGCNQNLANNAG
jgi:hypothetical protein